MKQCMIGLMLVAQTLFAPLPGFKQRIQVPLEDPAIVLLKTTQNGQNSSRCTAFIVKPNILVTARHCAENKTNITVHFSKTDFTGTLAKVLTLSPDAKEDWAILSAPTPPDVPPLKIQVKLPERHERLYLVGFPANSVPDSVPQQYITVGRFLTYDNEYRANLLWLPMYQGDSGGPVINQAGEVTGIAKSILMDEQGATNVSYATSSALWVEAIP